MPKSYRGTLRQLGLMGQDLDAPGQVERTRQEDLNPDNFRQIDNELARNPAPGQQEALMNERQRLEAMQLKQLQQASQQFAPRLAQSLDIQTHTGMPVEGPADKLIKLLLMMKKSPWMGSRMPGVNPVQFSNPRPAQPMPDIIGGVRG